jgi:hypothetical protein
MSDINNEFETVGIVDFETYIKDIVPHQIKSTIVHPYDFIDVPGIKFLKHIFAGFMSGPVAVYQGKPIEAKTRQVSTLDEIKHLALTSNLFLYHLKFCPNHPVYTTVNEQSFQPIPLLTEQIVQKSYWVVRYAEIVK